MWNTFLISIRRYKVTRPLYILKKRKKVKQLSEKFIVDSDTSAAVVNEYQVAHSGSLQSLL